MRPSGTNRSTIRNDSTANKRQDPKLEKNQVKPGSEGDDNGKIKLAQKDKLKLLETLGLE